MFYEDFPACHRRAPYCDECRERAYRQDCGTAAARGIGWADRVLRQLGRIDQPWPDTPRARAMAARHVDGLAGGDELLLERLARACLEAAAHRWEQLRTDEQVRGLVLGSRR